MRMTMTVWAVRDESRVHAAVPQGRSVCHPEVVKDEASKTVYIRVFSEVFQNPTVCPVKPTNGPDSNTTVCPTLSVSQVNG